MTSRLIADLHDESLVRRLESEIAASGLDEKRSFASVVQLLLALGRKQGFDEQRLLHGGAIDEILVSAKLGLVASRRVQGEDATTERGDKKLEIKHSRPRRGAKANIIYNFPGAQRDEALEAYVKRIGELARKIDTHKWVVLQAGEYTIYELDGQFFAHVLEYHARRHYASDGQRHEKVLNFGGLACRRCKIVHRMRVFAQASALYVQRKADVTALVEQAIEGVVASQCKV